MNLPATVVLAFDNPVVRFGLQAVLAGEPFEVVAECAEVRQVLDACRTLRPTLLVADVILETKDVFEVLAKLPVISPSTRAILLATTPEPIWIARGVAWAAQDFLLRSASRDEILTALRHAADGLSPVEGSRMAKMSETMNRRSDFPKTIPQFTGREMQALRLLALGLSNQEIARTIHVRLETAKEHVLNAMRKLDVADRTQAAVIAIQNGWLST
jgi:DNA-binding NarL/FixJ family response regulator